MSSNVAQKNQDVSSSTQQTANHSVTPDQGWTPRVLCSADSNFEVVSARHQDAAKAAWTAHDGYGYNMESADFISLEVAERAASIRAELGGPVVRPRQGRFVYRFVKRAFDVVFSVAVLVLLCWLYAIIALAIKIDDPEGPVFFTQKRVGKNGKIFTMHKFRSMVTDAEDHLEELCDLNEKTGPVFKIAKDPRITRVGRFIRRTSADELPQFIDVLKGNMSIVGPRPALPKEVAVYTDYQRQRLQVKPGITCYWQTRRNRDTITFDEWVDLDLLYIKKASAWTDTKLIIQTIGVVLTAQGS